MTMPNPLCPLCALLDSCVPIDLDATIVLLTEFVDQERCAACGLPWAVHRLAHPHCRSTTTTEAPMRDETLDSAVAREYGIWDLSDAEEASP